MALDKRLAGILLHPTSLPGDFGIGDLGPSAYEFLDWMQSAGLAYWQILPLGPTGFGDSPYQCFSAFAGNPFLISPEILVEQGVLNPDEIKPDFARTGPVDFGFVMNWKHGLFHKAFERLGSAPSDLRTRFEKWKSDPEIVEWLADYALFKALKKKHDEKGWIDWPDDVRSRKPAALAAAREQLKDDVKYQEFIQFLFFDQWNNVRWAAGQRGIEIIGDAPIYVSFDSADTWAHQDEFWLDADGRPIEVAGVPPDYFSKTGQLWGNPLYRWEKMAANNYTWWVSRLKAIFRTVDIVRLDHFRGFMGYYAVPASALTAETGKWKKGPGASFFKAVKQAIGDLPIIAEDLGEITEDVEQVRRQFELPGMVILQFAWSPAALKPLIADPNNHFLPHRHDVNSVVYTGTHDNDTTVGWWRNSSTPEEREEMQIYLSTDGNAPNWDLIRTGMRSVANTFVMPAQDLLNLDSDCRMNLPGRPTGNWTWRLQPGQLTAQLANSVRDLNLCYERCANPPAEAIPQPPKQPPY